jgi:hypothetical protein
MSSDTWGAAALATGMWMIASVALFGGDTKPPIDGVVWTLTSSQKVASHPTLVRRSLSSAAAALRTAELTLIASASR